MLTLFDLLALIATCPSGGYRFEARIIERVLDRLADRGLVFGFDHVEGEFYLDELAYLAPEPTCSVCRLPASKIPEYDEDNPAEADGTYNARTNLFLCTNCYITVGMPNHPNVEPFTRAFYSR